MSDFKLVLESATPLTPPSCEVGGIAKRIKTARLRRKTNLQKFDYPKAQIKRGPNAKHSTLPQGCFLCFCFWFHSRFGNNIIIAHVIFHWAHNWAEWTVVKDWSSLSCNSSAVPRWLWRWCEKRFARMRKKLYLCIAFREIHPWWQRSGYSSVRLEYTSGGRGVAGSNPVIPTTQKAW